MELETEFARRLARLSGRHKRELIDLLGPVPRLSNVTTEFWQRVETETEMEMTALLLTIFAASADHHKTLVAPDLQPVVLEHSVDAGRAWSRRRAQIFAREYVSNTQQRLAVKSQDWVRELPGLPEPVVSPSVVDDVTSTLGPNRIARIAATETTAAQTAGIGGNGSGGIVDQARSFGMVFDKIWRSERDSLVCPICRRFHNTPEEAWGSVVRGLGNLLTNGQEIIDRGGPPAHPHCRCYLVVKERAGRFMPDGSGGFYDVGRVA